MKYKRRKVYFKLYLSYIIILLLPILIGFIIYFQTLKSSREQADSLNRSLMQIVKNECDNQVKGVMRNLSRIAFDTRVQTLSNVKGRFQGENQYTLFSLYSDLLNSNFSAETYEDVFVYFANTNTVVSTGGNMSLELYYNLYYKNQYFTLPAMREYLAEFHFQDMLPVDGESGERSLLFTMNSLKSEIGETSAVIGIRMAGDILEQRIESAKWDDQIQVMILNSKNEIINSETVQQPEITLVYDELKEGGSFNYILDGTDYIGMVMCSEQIDWKYVLLAPRAVIEKNAREIQTACVAGLFACVLIGFAGSYYLTRMNYNPLRALMHLFSGQHKEIPQDENEYKWLQNQARLFLKEHTDIKLTLNQNKKLLRQYYAFRLLEYPYEDSLLASGKSQYETSLVSPYNVVLLFYMEDMPDEIVDEGQDDLKQASFEQKNSFYKFVVMNIAEEMLSEHYNVEMAEVGEMAAAIVNLPDKDEQHVEGIKEIISNAHRMIADKFRFNMLTLAGDIHKGMEGIHSSYREAREAEEYITLLDSEIIFYGEIKNVHKKYYYPMEMEYKIINAIKAGNSEQAGVYINQLLDVNLDENKVSASVYKCLLFDMMGTMMKAADEVGCSGLFGDAELPIQVSVKLPLVEVKARFGRAAEALCDNSSRLRGNADNELSEKIKNYIQVNYNDPDLNISQTGFYFDMTPAYISTMFKKQTGKSLLKYINAVRIEEAKKLLDQGVSVVETARQVGFRDSRTFIRVFKEYVGMTPGQMKKLKS